MTASRYNTFFYAILAASALLYCSLNPLYHIGVYNDDAMYVLAAKDLWNPSASGAMSLIHRTPDFPFPGLPLLLAPLVKVIEPHWALMDWLSVIVTSFSVVLLGLWVRKWLPAKEALGVVMLYAFNPIIAKFSGILLPGPYFLVALLACLLFSTIFWKSLPCCGR